MALKNNKTAFQVAITWSIGFLALIFVLLAVSCSDDAQEQPKHKNLLQDGDYVHFQLGSEKVKVSAAYLRGGSENQYGTLEFVELWAMLPDFEAYDKNVNNDQFVKELGWGRKIFITLISRSRRPAKLPKIIELKSKGKYRPISGRVGRYDEMLYGLEVYRSNNYGDDDYLYRQNGETLVYIQCGSKKQNAPFPSCDMLWDLTDSVAAEATFGIQHLPEWKAVWNRANKLIEVSAN